MESTGISFPKKLIRLTEGDLHRIVKESVNKVLTELDWKTYMNAGKKRLSQRGPEYNQKKYKNGFDSLHQAEKEFDKNYGYNVVRDKDYDHREWFDYPEKQGITRTYGDVEGQYNGNPEGIRMQAKTDVSLPNSKLPHGGNGRRTLTYDPKYKYATMDQFWSNDHSPEHVENDYFYKGSGIDRDKEPILANMIKQNHDRAKEELDAYENGDYVYQKGKGWQLKH